MRRSRKTSRDDLPAPRLPWSSPLPGAPRGGGEMAGRKASPGSARTAGRAKSRGRQRAMSLGRPKPAIPRGRRAGTHRTGSGRRRGRMRS